MIGIDCTAQSGRTPECSTRATTRPMRHRKMEREATRIRARGVIQRHLVALWFAAIGCGMWTCVRRLKPSRTCGRRKPGAGHGSIDVRTRRGILDPSFNFYETYGPQTRRRGSCLMNPKINRWRFCSFAAELSRFTKPQSMKNPEPQVVGTQAESAGGWVKGHLLVNLDYR
ncbi:hypothetical protein EDB84DRAFT_1514515 [Lactarius hengduanensis]|nr:hypothetical protein EDB84DRAFT_1514515 [Lactarius hengduanensis]